MTASTETTGKPDWKHRQTIILTLIGFVITLALAYWSFYYDKYSKSLDVRVVSMTSLKLKTDTDLEGLKITFDGVPLRVPYLTTLELKHSGSKPITASDFSSPIEITSKSAASIVRVSVSSTTPKNLEPTVHMKAGTVTIDPLLLNDGDSIRLDLLSTGGYPDLDVRARIAGVSNVSIDHQPSVKYIAYKGLLLSILMLLYSGLLSEAVSSVRRKEPQYLLFISALGCLQASFHYLNEIRTLLALELWESLLPFAIAFFFGHLFVPKRPTPK